MNTEKAFIEWIRRPLGIYTARLNGFDADVTQTRSNCWEWVVIKDGKHIDNGFALTMDEACEAAILVMEDR